MTYRPRGLKKRITEKVQVSHGSQAKFHVNRHTQDLQPKVTELWLVSNRSVKVSLHNRGLRVQHPSHRLEVTGHLMATH